MMRLPALTEIQAAERKVELGARKTLDEFANTRAAVRATLAKPSTIALVAFSSGVLGFWFARRRVSHAKSERSRAPNPVAGLVLTFLLQFAMRRLPLILEHVSAARGKRAAPGAGPGDSSVIRPPSTSIHAP